ncbi:unnamed protein product [Rotaria magnacalcarata]|uniref:HAT C-terminal dimerisation domain-containing protein n=2 Tax=Rotaria magnacalcarata TaxID=392030 RepID=A0A816QEC9_9BILA|nr:unnamed protein product [Rotaria magnacalcarata]CAF3929691.1 unnamed protein product [Rotaria magnacalcarata]CAF4083266.1 unnamed protein product [Rotaria magnacalcarata]
MSVADSEQSVLSKAELQRLIASDNPKISFKKPTNKRRECWTNYSQIYHENNPQDYIMCLQCKSVLRWAKDHGTRVMTPHNCSKPKPVSTTPSRQRTISSYCEQPSLSKECSSIQKRITETCVEYCAVDGRPFESVAGSGFQKLAKQLIYAGATLGTSINSSELLPHPSTISRNVEHVYLNLKKQLISLCAPLECFCITCDFWTAKITGVHYGGISLHYIDEELYTLQWSIFDVSFIFESFFYELPSVLSDEHKKNYLKVDRDNLESICKYLKQFHDIIEKLSCEKSPTIHLVVPYKQFLINLSIINENDDQLIIPLKNYIAKELPDYWIMKDILFIATILHPNLKSFNHTPHQKYYAEALLKSEFDKYHDLQQRPSSSNNNNKKRKQIHEHKRANLASTLDDIFDLASSPNKSQDETETKTEFDKYIQDNTKIDKDMNLLIYWKNNESTYPTLAKIAKRILSIPATNTSVERLFSDSGNTITNRRTRLQTSKVNQLLFIRRNLQLLRELLPQSVEQIQKRKKSTTSTTPMKKRKYSRGEDNDKDVSQEDDDIDVSQEDDDNDLSQEYDKNDEIQDELDNATLEYDDEKENHIYDD